MTQFDVFLSHSSVDKSWVSRLKDHLRRYGISVWLDQDEIRPGDRFAEALEQALDNCRAVALIVSPEAIASGWVKEEYYHALSLPKIKQARVQLIPVILRDAQLPGFLQGRNWVDFRNETAYHQNVWKLVWGITGQQPDQVLEFSTPDDLIVQALINYHPTQKYYYTRFTTSAGNGVAPFELNDLAGLCNDVNRLRKNISLSLHQDDAMATTCLDLAGEIGRRLFQALFTAKGLDLYRECRDRLRRPEYREKILFIKISSPDSTIAQLPWELLFNPDEPTYMSLNQRTPIIRFKPDSEVRHMSYESEWRVLLVGTQPPGTARLDIQPGIQAIETAFQTKAPTVNVQIKHLFISSSDELSQTLRDFRPHIFHLVGYGGSRRLLLDDVQPGTPIDANRLLSTLLNMTSLRLVLLNTFEKEESFSVDNLRLSYILSRANIPAIVANQFPIRANVAEAMTAAFYQALAGGESIDKAVLHGRLALQGFRADKQQTMEWATPVLHLQTPDGHVFRDLLKRQQGNVSPSLVSPSLKEREATGQEPAKLEQAVEAETGSPSVHQDAEEPYSRAGDRLQRWYTAAQEALAAEEGEKALSYLKQISQVDIHYKETALLMQQARRQQRLAAFYEEGLTAYQEGEWTKAIELFGQLQTEGSDYKDVVQKIEAAEKQERYDTLYLDGLAHLKRERWAEAVALLGQVEPDDRLRRAQSRDLEYAQVMQRYERLGDQAKRWEDRRSDWADVVAGLDKIVGDSADYPKATEALQTARRQLTTLKHYETGVKELEAGHWPAAIRAFEEVEKIDDDYRDAFKLLQQARTRQVLAERYQRGEKYFQERQWAAALAEFQEIFKQDQEYEKVGWYLKQAEREAHLKQLFDQAQAAYNAGDLATAIDNLEQVRQIAPDYNQGAVEVQLAHWREEREARQTYEAGVDYFTHEQWSAAIAAFESIPAGRRDKYPELDLQLARSRLELDLEQKYGAARQRLGEQDWDQAIKLLREIQQTGRDYKETAGLLQQAEAGWLEEHYERAKQYQAAAQWPEAAEALQAILKRRPDFADVTARLALVEQRQELDRLYTALEQAFAAKNWAGALTLLDEIEGLKPADIEKLKAWRDQVERGQKIERLYHEGQAAFERADWPLAERKWAEVLVLEPEHEDVGQKLDFVRRQHELANLYTDAEAAYQAEDWARAGRLYDQVARIDPDYQDVSHKRDQARKNEQLAQLYQTAEGAYAAGEWRRAIEQYQIILRRTDDYKDSAAKLEQARRQETLARLYNEGQEFEQSNDFVEALSRYQLAHTIDAAYKDIADKIASLKTLSDLEDLYQQGLAALAKGIFPIAVSCFQSVQEIDPDFKEINRLLQEAHDRANLKTWLDRGRQAFREQDWGQAVKYFKNIQTLPAHYPEYSDVSQDLEQAEQQLQWDQWYEAGLACLDRQDWAQAASFLQRVDSGAGRRRNQPRELAYARAMQAFSQAHHRVESAADKAADWQAVRALLEPIHRESPNYRDVARRLRTARNQQKWIEQYEEARQAMAHHRWAIAIHRLETISSENPGYRDVGQKLQSAREQQQAAEHYQQGQQFLQQGQLMEAQRRFQQVLMIDAGYLDTSALLTEVEAKIGWAELYQQAHREYETGQLETAIISLTRLVDQVPTYRDGEAKSLLEAWKQKNKAQTAYQRGRAYADQGAWSEAIRAFEQVLEIAPADYSDAAVRLEDARLKARLKNLYDQAQQAVDSGKWEEAIKLLTEVRDQEAGYGDASQLLQQAEEERWLEEQYQAAIKYREAGEWDQALTVLEDIRRRRDNYADVAGQIEDIHHQKQLLHWYNLSRAAIEESDWSRAIENLNRLKAMGGQDYRDYEHLHELAQTNQALAQGYDQARAALDAGDLEAAEERFNEIVHQDENYRDAHVQLANIRRQKRLVELRNKAEMAYEHQKWSEAAHLYQQILDIDSGDQEAQQRQRETDQLGKYLRTATRLESEGKLAEALKQYQAMRSYKPALTEIDQKIKALSRTIELTSLYRKATTLLEQENFGEGIPALQAVVEQEPEFNQAAQKLNQAVAAYRAELERMMAVAKELQTIKAHSEALKWFEKCEQAEVIIIESERILESIAEN